MFVLFRFIGVSLIFSIWLSRLGMYVGSRSRFWCSVMTSFLPRLIGWLTPFDSFALRKYSFLIAVKSSLLLSLALIPETAKLVGALDILRIKAVYCFEVELQDAICWFPFILLHSSVTLWAISQLLGLVMLIRNRNLSGSSHYGAFVIVLGHQFRCY